MKTPLHIVIFAAAAAMALFATFLVQQTVSSSVARDGRVLGVTDEYDPTRTHLSIAVVADGSSASEKVLTTQLESYLRYNADGSTMKFRYLLDGEPISPFLDWPAEYTWDASEVAPGWHLLRSQVIDGTDIHNVRSQDVEYFHGDPTSDVGELIPVTGDRGIKKEYRCCTRKQLVASMMADWIPKLSNPPSNTVHPYPYESEAPAYTRSAEEKNNLIENHGFTMTGLVMQPQNFFNEVPIFRSDPVNGLLRASYYWYKGASTVESHADAMETSTKLGAFLRDGGRNDNAVSPYNTLIADERGPGWIGINNINGRIYAISKEGSVTTLAGPRTPKNVFPERAGGPFEYVGTFENDLKFDVTYDAAFHPTNKDQLFVADTGNNRIALVDGISSGNPTISTYAGVPWPRSSANPPEGGFKDGSRLEAYFNRPTSLVFVGEDLYITDLNNDRIRKITPDGIVSSLFVDVSSKPQVVRPDSNGNLIVGYETEHDIRRLNIDDGSSDVLLDSGPDKGKWIWLDVDRYGDDPEWGHVGKKDDIYIAISSSGNFNIREFWNDSSCCASNSKLVRLAADGSSGSIVAGNNENHYVWPIAIDDEEAKFVTGGFGGSAGLTQYRPRRQSDPFGVSRGIKNYGSSDGRARKGLRIFEHGTVEGFPYGSRPSFQALRSADGINFRGLPNFDDLTSMSDEDLAGYIQGGMGGSVPRPEITGNDLNNLMYRIRNNTLATETQEFPIKPLDPDRTAPDIMNISARQVTEDSAEITWTTSEPTLGLVHHGVASNKHHGWSAIESGYTTSHTAVIKFLAQSKDNYFAIRSKDVAGNQTLSAEGTIFIAGNFDGDDSTPPTISAINADAASTSATITWNTNEGADGQVEYGLSEQLGSRTARTGVGITSHSITLTGLQDSQTYFYRVRSRDSAGNEAISGIQQFRTGAGAAACNYIDSPLGSGGPTPTITAIQSGSWSDIATWSENRLPSANDNVQIAGENLIVTMDMPYDDSTNPEANTVTVTTCATLQFPRSVDTALDITGSLVVSKGARLDAGTRDSRTTGKLRLGFNVAKDGDFVGSSADSPDPDRAQNQSNTDIGLWTMDDDSSTTFAGNTTQNGIWMKLGATARAGSSELQLSNTPMGWAVGDTIAIATTSRDSRETETAVITAIDGNTLTVAEPLSATHQSVRYAHNHATGVTRKLDDGEDPTGEERLIPLQAEVAKLSQNVHLVGNLVTEGDTGHRSHNIAVHGGRKSFVNTEVRNFGPTGKLGRYGMHFHLTGESNRGSEVEATSLWSSVSEPNNRGIEPHQSNGVLLKGNVIYKSTGAGIYIEDALETGVVVEDNLILETHGPEHPDLANESLASEFNYPIETAAGIWARDGNEIKNNVVVGGVNGATGIALTPLSSAFEGTKETFHFTNNEIRAYGFGLGLFGDNLGVSTSNTIVSRNQQATQTSLGSNEMKDSIFFGNGQQPESNESCPEEISCVNNTYVATLAPLINLVHDGAAANLPRFTATAGQVFELTVEGVAQAGSLLEELVADTLPDGATFE